MPEQPASWQPLPPDATPAPSTPSAWPAPGVNVPATPGYYPYGQSQGTGTGQGYYVPAPPYSAPGYSPTTPYHGPIDRPSTLTWAAGLMGLGALLAAIAVFSGLSALPANDTGTAGSLSADFVLGGLVGIALWIWMAIANYRGNQWARVTATVFFGLDCLLFLGSLGVASHLGTSAFRLLLSAAQWTNGLVIIILLWNSKTSFYVSNRPR